VSLAISDMDDYIRRIRSELEGVWPDLQFYTFGHMGDGNLHLYVCCGQNDNNTKQRVEEMVYKPLQQVGGSITGEHGVGLEKKPWLHLSRSEQEIQLMKTIKRVLDPKGILNRGKLFA